MKDQAKNIKEKIKSMDDCETKRKILEDLTIKEKGKIVHK
jgi:hypothetical protein